MPEEITTQVETVKDVPKGTLGFSIKDPTPMWATWVFRAEFFLNKALMAWIASTHIIADSEKGEIILILIGFDSLIWGLARSIGIKPPEETK